jgi:hypothetical protein
MACWKSMINSWHKVKELSSWELWVLLQALCLLPLLVMGLRLKGFKSIHSTLANRLPVGDVSIENNTLSQAYSIARMVREAAVHGFCSATCLPQSLLLWWFLRRRRIGGDLRFGVHKRETRFEAHAWVEVDGVPVNDTEDVQERYIPLGKIEHRTSNIEC